ncbi:BPTD_3080 family restriction endonuclease [Gryllotalpicola ginsengisoli]|uniref:BPTD_3080 family restriction endonuclease n=1 Tax=Gryllotalpicola ginsengisoli TaxID=444608 RepID=UPI0003B6FAE0|nr:DEAD/DEAH box helicase family protein [Gryllotalpicola ginsengisoli]
MSSDAAAALQNPVINSPYDPPTHYFVVGPHGPTGEIKAGRRPSESFIPIPQSKKRGKKAAHDDTLVEIDFDFTGERRQANSLINQLRDDVELWRARGYEHVTHISRKLLQHWADSTRENRILYGQREAAETAIFLTEAAGKGTYRDWSRSLDEANAEYNSGLPRVALKLATGSGKTVVMAMLIAWQTLNRQYASGNAQNRWAQKFLLVAPGITIRDRLQVLKPTLQGNYYDEREIVPPDLRQQLNSAQLVITNYHAFLPRVRREFQGVNALTKNILSESDDPGFYNESESEVVSRVLRDFGKVGKNEPIVVFNDEAHHCYQDKPQHTAGIKLTKEQEAANTDARVWFKGLQAAAKLHRIPRIFDLSATPFYLSGSGYTEGYLFPWVVSDYSLMDAIEAGIVKVPRVPVNDDSADDTPTYLDLWQKIGDKLPKRQSTVITDASGWNPPAELEGALNNLYGSYEKSFARWQDELASLGEPPPVMIVVCPNTLVSKLVYEWIAGREITEGEQTIHTEGRLPLFSNAELGRRRARPQTILVDSVQLESGDALSADFKSAAAEEIEAFKDAYRRSSPGADADQLSDADILREVLNTVGKKGKLGEQVRCIVSVAMLTEGWDANTVTHILGIRAFGSQLLCEQVVGRGLRRRSYVLNDEGRFEPEYSNVYGIPFAFIPSDVVPTEKPPAPPAIEVGTVEGREEYRISFPKLDGYRLEIPSEHLFFDPSDARRLLIGPSTVPDEVTVEGYVGESEVVRDDVRDPREQRAAYRIAEYVYRQHFMSGDEDIQPWTFPRLREIASEYLTQCVDYDDGFDIRHLLRTTERLHEAAEAIWDGITRYGARDDESRVQRIRPLLRRFDPIGDTSGIRFLTRKAVYETRKSEISHVVLDGQGGNTWEQLVASQLELIDDVAAYVKNDHLGFTIPYVHKGRTHAYVPDFIVRLRRRDGDVQRMLVIEVSGGQKSPGPTIEKADTARNSWCVAVNNHRGFGRWGYIELTSMVGVEVQLREAIDSLYADKPIVGDPDLLSAFP